MTLNVDWKYFLGQLDKIKDIVYNKDQDFVLVIEGHERIGKSTLALKICKYFEPKFNVDNIIFTPKSFINAIRNADKHSLILYDEAGIGLYKRDSSTYESKTINKILMTIGQRNLLLILCIPSFRELDKYVRYHRVNGLIRVVDRGRARAYSSRKIKKIKQDRFGKMYYPSCEFAFPFKKMTGKLWESYQVHKRKQLDEFLDKIDSEMRAKDTSKDSKVTKKDMIIELSNEGNKSKDIAKILNVSREYVYKVRSEHNLTT